MVDVTGVAYAVLFIAVLLTIGIVVFGYVADLTGDPFYTNEILIDAGCSENVNSTCIGTTDNTPIENTTRAQPVLTNCSASGATCQAMTAGTHYRWNSANGTFDLKDDINNGTIQIDYYQDVWRDDVDNAQQSISDNAYSGFDLGMVMAIVMAAVGVMAGIFLIGRRGA